MILCIFEKVISLSKRLFYPMPVQLFPSIPTVYIFLLDDYPL